MRKVKSERERQHGRERDRSKYIEVERQRKGVRGKKREVERVGERKKAQTTTHTYSPVTMTTLTPAE